MISQIKINLPVELKDFIGSKASKYGLPMAAYIKHLIIKDVSDIEHPTFTLSVKAENTYKQARISEEKGNYKEVSNVKKFLDEL